MNRRSLRRIGFTLIELLVVVSIIALLLAILLPSLAGVRDQAKSALCGTNLDQICTGMQNYAAEYNGAIVGSPADSGGYMLRVGNPDVMGANCMQVWDYIGPLYALSSHEVPLGKQGTNNLLRRFDAYRRMKAFQCPSNNFTAFPWVPGQNDAGTGPMISYNTSRNFMWLGTTARSAYEDSLHWNDVEQPSGQPSLGGRGLGRVPDYYKDKPPSQYVPNVDGIGDASGKVFAADGARYSDINQQPDYDADPYGGYGGAFGDVGPYTARSESWNRTCSPGARPEFFRFLVAQSFGDPRLYSYRHGSRQPAQAGFKMQVGFYDGHVELMRDDDSANPHMWIPRGGTLQKDSNLWDDVTAKYFTDAHGGSVSVIKIN
jgi:prepilin-type N-terminal cleavage/methylation domain-containing protein/prepilin-type processing-associated H-X9-DG protein